MRDYKWIDDIDKDSISCLGAVGIFALALLAVFLCPLIELWIWQGVFIPKFNAPELTFWDMFFIHTFVSLINPVSNYVRRK